jgi:hypothetical protein
MPALIISRSGSVDVEIADSHEAGIYFETDIE